MNEPSIRSWKNIFSVVPNNLFKKYFAVFLERKTHKNGINESLLKKISKIKKIKIKNCIIYDTKTVMTH